MHEFDCKGELSCPVCLLPLSISPSFRAHGTCGNQHQMERKINTGRYRPGKIVEINIVVSALCGHLFHKLCLRHYCLMYKQNADDFEGKIECPLCLQKLSLAKFLTIDYKSCLSSSDVIEKCYRHTLSMNEELTNQWNSTVNTMSEVEYALKDSQSKLQSSKDKLVQLHEKIADAKSRAAKKDVIISNIKHFDRMMDLMHRENIQLIKLYLMAIRGQSTEFLREKRIPEPLIPYLHIISGDERLLRKFGEILQPVEVEGFRSNTDILIKEILTEVRSTEISRKHSNPVANLLQQHLIKWKNKVRGARALVKVRRSSATLPNRAEESVQQIMKNVKEPIKTRRNAHEKIKPKIVEGSHRSGSEIQVLLEPKKKRHDVTDSKLERLPVGDSEFIERNPFYLRRCKSTLPVLIKHWGRKEEAKVFGKAEDIKQDDVLEVVAKDQEPVKQLTQLEVNEEKVELSFKDLESTGPSCGEKKSKKDSSNNKKKSRILGNKRKRTGHPTSTDNMAPTAPAVDPPGSVIDILYGSKSEIDESIPNPGKEEVFMQNAKIRIKAPPRPTDLHLLHLPPPPGLWGNLMQLYSTTDGPGFYGASCVTRTPVFIRPVEIQGSYPRRSFIPVVQRVQPSYMRRWLSKLPSQNESIFGQSRRFTHALPALIPQPHIFPQVYYPHYDVSLGGGKSSQSSEYDDGKRNEDHSDHKRNAPFGDMTSQIIVTEEEQSTPLDSAYVTIDIPPSNERLFGGNASCRSCGLESHRSSIRRHGEDNVLLRACPNSSHTFHHIQSQHNNEEECSRDYCCKRSERRRVEKLVSNNLMKSASSPVHLNNFRESEAGASPHTTEESFPDRIPENNAEAFSSETQFNYHNDLQSQRTLLKANKRRLS